MVQPLSKQERDRAAQLRADDRAKRQAARQPKPQMRHPDVASPQRVTHTKRSAGRDRAVTTGILTGAALTGIPVFAVMAFFTVQQVSESGGVPWLAVGTLTSPVGAVLLVATPFLAAVPAATVGAMLGWGAVNVFGWVLQLPRKLKRSGV